METILQIKVEENVLHSAENYAKLNNKSLPDMVNDFLLSISAEQNQAKNRSEVNTYKELVSALEEGDRAIREGRVVPVEKVREKIRKYAGINDV